jgi:hypothetical protein
VVSRAAIIGEADGCAIGEVKIGERFVHDIEILSVYNYETQKTGKTIYRFIGFIFKNRPGA